MHNTILKIAVLLLTCSLSYGQDFSALWQSHYSYNNIVDVVSGNTKIYAAAENAVFEYDPISEELKTITTIEGLSGREITTLYYSQFYESLLIGYETGLIEIYSESDNSVLSVVDVLEKLNITADNKRINHFYENEGLIYIASNFGISVYDLERLEFGDTYFLGNGGSQITVKQVSVLNNQIYAACLNNNGIKKGALTNPNLIDFSQWETISNSNYNTINTFNNKAYAVRSDNILFEITGNTLNAATTLPAIPLDAEASVSNLIFSTANAVYAYDENIQLTNTFLPTTTFDTDFTAVTQLDEFIYIGTKNSGLLKILITETEDYTQIKPNGPLENSVFKINATTQNVWATFGEYDGDLNPYPLTSKGISYFNENTWKNIPVDSVLGTQELNSIAPNIFNPQQVFISSFFNGLLELNDFEPIILLNQTNSALESLDLPSDPNYIDIRISASQFDSNGLLWVLNSKTDKALKSFDPISRTWKGYSFSDIIEDPLNDQDGFFDMAIGNNGTKWIGSLKNGLIAYNETISGTRIRNMNSENQNIPPFSRFRALALDTNNILWVGTTQGLRVLFNTAGFFEDPNPTLSQVIILEDGIAKELLEDQTITDIKVDSSNNKWIGTADAGVFYVSPDGQNTIYHFITDNSPLPSNTINDISLNTEDGIVYMATNRGLLAFTAGGSSPDETLNDAYVYPNPVRPEYNILGSNDLNDINKGVKIKGLTERVNIKITDIEGNLVAEAQSGINFRSSGANYNFAIDGGTAIWNGKNLANNVVATGVYLILVSDLESFETKVLKVLIVR